MKLYDQIVLFQSLFLNLIRKHFLRVLSTPPGPFQELVPFSVYKVSPGIMYIDSPIFSNWTGRIGAPEGQITLWHISTKSNFSPAGIYEHMMIEKCWEKTCSRWGKCRTLGLRIVQKIYPCSYSEGRIRNANSKYISQICKSSYPWVRSDFVCMVWRCLLFCKRRRASGLFFFTISS